MSGGGVKLLAAGAAVIVMASGIKHHGHDHAVLTSVTGASTSSSNEQLGMSMAAAQGWTGGQAACLNWLWTRESGWSNTADNPKSGAYGIAQALGHGPTNQYPAGPANPPQSDPRAQIRWGLTYVADQYGTPCNAWAHEVSAGWY